MAKLNWDANDFQNSQDSSGTTSDNISHSGKLQQGYSHGSLTRGLVAYYPMEKGEGEVLHDGAMDNLGQINGASWDDSGNNGTRSLSFDGVDNIVTVSDDNVFDIESGDILTVSLWFKTNSDDNYIPLIGKGDSSGGVHHVWDFHQRDLTGDGNADDFRFAWQDGSNGVYAEMEDVSYGTWHHIVGIFNQNTGTLTAYLDGTKHISNSGNISGWTNSDNLEVGGGGSENSGNAGYWSGKIEDVRIYNRPLSESEIKALYNSGNGVQSGLLKKEKNVPSLSEGGISRYKLDGNTDDSWGDNNGTNNGADLTVTGVYGTAADFTPNENDSILVSSGDDGNKPLGDTGESKFTISSWIYVKNHKSANDIFSRNYAGTGDINYLFRGQEDGRIQFYYGDNAYYSNRAIPVETWKHVLITVKDGVELSMYIDGSLDSTRSINSINWTSNADVTVGASDSRINNIMDGKIDDVRIYDRALTPVQVEELYHKGAYRIPRESTLQ